MGLPNYVLFLVVVVGLIFVTFLFTATQSDDNKIIESGGRPVVFSRELGNGVDSLEQNSFLSEGCLNFLTQHPSHNSAIKWTVVVMVAKDIRPEVLSKSIKSIATNSGKTLTDFYIMDDCSDAYVSEFPEWSDIRTEFPHITFKIVRLRAYRGNTFAKNYAVKLLTETERFKNPAFQTQTMIVFASPVMIVSDQWLVPLSHSLTKYPNGVVYPVMDILTDNDQGEDEVIKSENVVAAFDWSLKTTWEPADQASARLGSIQSDQEASAEETLSPAAPQIFATKLSHFVTIGQFDSSLVVSHDAPDYVEFSIRQWLCGGPIIRHSCSHAAVFQPNMFGDAEQGQSVTQRSIDVSVMTIANKWLDSQHHNPITENSNSNIHYKELAFQARFLNRVPYGVETSPDPVKDIPFHGSYETTKDLKGQPVRMCQNFDWYLKEVFPGLLHDSANVIAQYKQFLSSDAYLKEALSDVYDQYNKVSQIHTDNEEIKRLQSRERLLQTGILKDVLGTDFHKIEFKEPRAVVKKVVTKMDLQIEAVRENLICQDFPDDNTCSDDRTSHEQCVKNKANLMFVCPKKCGLCDGAQFCEDLYLNKCIAWQKDGQCESIDPAYGVIRDICRKSCGVCTQDADKAIAAEAIKAPPMPPTGDDAPEGKPPVDGLNHNQPPGGVAGGDRWKGGADPTFLHSQWIAGAMPELVPSDAATCSLNDKPNGNILGRINIASKPKKDVRIFCGIYTMEKNHETNVKATRNTWAKRCDGFMAFSTKEDISIPSIFIEHEGAEDYNNMWQKSRSIWKYIYTHYKDEFDFFILGGDDMFYIVENLRAYLASDEIQKLQAERNGLYLGRKFQPPGSVVFNSGGAGYTLDAKALNMLGNNIDSPKCFPHQVGFWEDVNVANCLKVSSGNEVVPYDTRDTKQRERFHPFTPGQHLTYRIPKVPDWYAKYNPDLKVGYECCSDESISFHYVPADIMTTLYNYVYNCPHKVRAGPPN